jgi:hypothetical protein
LGLQAAVLDALFLHALLPNGVDPVLWRLHTEERICSTMTFGSGHFLPPDRLRRPPAGVDLESLWSRRACWARRYLGALGLQPPWWMPAPQQGETALSCSHATHRPWSHPHLDAIVGHPTQAPPLAPLHAEQCFCTAWALSSPMLSPEQRRNGRAWLARCGAGAWSLLVVELARWTGEGPGA